MATDRAFANTPRRNEHLQLGRVLGLIDAGIIAGYWVKRDATEAANLIEHRYRISRVRDVLLRGDDVSLRQAPDVDRERSDLRCCGGR